MAANLTRLNVALTLTTGAFSRSTAAALKSAQSFGAELSKSLLTPMNAVATALSGAALTAGVARATERIDALAKASDRLGVTTQALAGMRLAASDAGVQAEQLEQAMGKVVVKVEQAAAGNVQAAAAFRTLNLSVSELAGMSADRQFAAISDAIRGMESPAQRTAAAVALLGEEGGKMMNALTIGSDGLRKAGEEASRLGLAVSRVDAAKVEEARQAFDRIGLVIEGVFNTAAVKLAPIITVISGELVKASVQTNAFGTVMDTVLKASVNVAGLLANSWAGLTLVFKTLKVGVYQVGGGFVTMANAAVADAQRIGLFFGRAWDAIKASAHALWAALKTGWSGAKIPVYDYIQFTGTQLASLLRMASDAVMRFDIATGTAMLEAANTIQVSVGAMGATARKELDQNLAQVRDATAQAGTAFGQLFAAYEVTGSKALQDIGASMQATIQAESDAIDAIINSSTPWQQLEDRLAYEQAAAQSRAEARAAEIAAAQEHSRQTIEIEDQKLQYLRFGSNEHYNWLNSSGAANSRQALSQTSNFFGNLSALQQSHNKRAKAIGEAAAKAKIVTDTASAAMAAYASLAGIPIVGPGLGAAAAAAAIAAGAVQLSNVGKDNMGGGGGGTSNMGGPGSSMVSAAPAQPTQTVILQGDSISSESLVRMFREAKEKGFVIDEVRRA